MNCWFQQFLNVFLKKTKHHNTNSVSGDGFECKGLSLGLENEGFRIYEVRIIPPIEFFIYNEVVA